MSDRPTYPPPPPPPPAEDGEERERDRHGERPSFSPGFERIVPELLKRGLEAGRGTLEKNLGESFFPKEVAAQLVTHIGDLRQGVVTAVAQEVGLFLREADIASEIRQLMTGLEVEAKVHLTFREAKGGTLETDVKVDNHRGRRRRRRGRARASEPEPEADSSPPPAAAAETPKSSPPESPGAPAATGDEPDVER